jgi:hypothetical protein
MSDSIKKYFEMQTDGIVEDVKYIMDKRSEKGQKEYGTTLEDNPDGFYKFLDELQMELLDAALYIQKIKKLNK